MMVLGIDPGSRWCGYGVVARDRSRMVRVASGVITLGKATMERRLASLLEGLGEVIVRCAPEEVAIESVFSGTSARSALVLGQARGIALAAAGRAGLPVFEYAPAEAKLAFAGNGRAEKEQMVRMAHALFGVKLERSDEADALALAVCHLSRRVIPSRSSRRVGVPRPSVILRPARLPPEIG